ncbi:MAG: radical SAM protein [Acidobacteriota bacterium]|jgi:wyosine [tRNA(Phe)-imidazoG37] synthetase (radical SAM superfamily)
MGFVFGPLPSRRLGQSLGVDPLPLKRKVCNWNCIYCQLGRTVPLSNERSEYFARESILAEVRDALVGHKPGAIDWVTLVGSGETTLHAGIGWLIRQIKNLTDIPVAVITNGSLLHLQEVREELRVADAVLSSLDAGNARLYRRINRPWPALSYELLLDGLVAFRREYRGQLWIEVMLMKGINDGEKELQEIAGALLRIGPDQVHISLPSRPPAETSVQLPDEDRLNRAAAILGCRARIIQASNGTFDLSGYENAADAVLAIISRHPMQEEQLRRTLERWSPGQVEEALRRLHSSGEAQIVERYGKRYWSAAACRYPSCGTSTDRADPGS